MISTLKNYGLVVAFMLATLSTFSQSGENKKTVKKIIKLSTETEFSDIAKLFDTTEGRKPVNPFLLDYIWRQFEEKYGNFRNSKTIDEYVKKEREYFIEELHFDSAYVQIKVGFNPENGMVTAYLIQKEITKKQLELEKKYRIPKYVNKAKIAFEEAEFGEKPYIIQGELTLPSWIDKKEKVPAVILVHGSGPGDRNAKSGPLQAFKDIAYGLSAKGIVVLRYDKRTHTYAADMAAEKGLDLNKEVVDDVLHAKEYLKTLKNINTNNIYVLGHSLGGMMLPRIATKAKDIAGLIYMAAPAKGFEDKVIEQMEYLTTLHPDKKREYDRMKEDFVRLKNKWYDSTTNPRYLPFGSPPSYWMDIQSYQQTEVVKSVTQPMLFLQGEADYQVTVEDLELWKKALKNNNNVVYKLYPKLTHQMSAIDREGLSIPKDYETPANVDVAVINDIFNWITIQSK